MAKKQPEPAKDKIITNKEEAAKALADKFVNSSNEESGDLIRAMIDHKRGK